MANRKKNPPPRETPKAQTAPAPTTPAPSTRRWLWLWRVLAAVLAPVLVLALIEGGLRLAGRGYRTSFFLRDNIGGREVFTDNDRFGWRFFGPALARTPRPMVLDAHKPPGVCRVFVFGESAAYGDPQPEFGLPRALDALLSARHPETRFEVVNVAMTAINSHAILPIARECAGKEGDIWVIYMGNNEVVGPFGSGTIFGPQAPGRALIQASLTVKSLRAAQWMEEAMTALATRKNAPTEWKGLAMFLGQQVEQNDPRMARVYANFEGNLRDILHLGLDHRAKIVLSTVGVNLADSSPFASRHRPGLDAAGLKTWELEFAAGRLAATNDPAAALAHFERASAIDDRFAELHFRWGRACLALSRDAEARQHLALACDLDTLRFRADTRINQIIRDAASDAKNPALLLADTEQLLAQKSPRGIPGAAHFYEHVHLNFDGNYEAALGIARQVEKLLPENAAGKTAPPDWATRGETAARLAWTDYQRSKTLRSITLRLSSPPFSNQSSTPERLQAVRGEIEALAPAVRASGVAQAIDACQNALRTRPDDWTLRGLLAQLDQQAARPKESEAERRRILDLIPHSAWARSELGLALLQENRLDEAIEQFDRALEKQPRMESALSGKALALARKRDPEAALRQFARAAELHPQSLEARFNYANALSAAGRADAAREQYRAALGCEIEKPDMASRLAQTVFNLDWTNEAVEAFSRACQLDPFDAKTSVYYAQTLSSAGRHAEARARFLETARLNPALPEPHLGLGMEMLAENDLNGAAREFTESTRLDSNFLSGHLNLGILELRAGNRPAAAPHFREVLRIDPANAVARQFFGEK